MSTACGFPRSPVPHGTAATRDKGQTPLMRRSTANQGRTTMPNDLELFQGEGPAAQPTATAPMSGLTQRLARAWQHLRTMRSQARSAAARGADINAMQRIPPTDGRRRHLRPRRRRLHPPHGKSGRPRQRHAPPHLHRAPLIGQADRNASARQRGRQRSSAWGGKFGRIPLAEAQTARTFSPPLRRGARIRPPSLENLLTAPPLAAKARACPRTRPSSGLPCPDAADRCAGPLAICHLSLTPACLLGTNPPSASGACP